MIKTFEIEKCEIIQKIIWDNSTKLKELNKPDAICGIWKLILQVVNKGLHIPNEGMNMTTKMFNEIFETDFPNYNSETETQKDYIINMCMSGDALRGYEMRNEYGGFVRG